MMGLLAARWRSLFGKLKTAGKMFGIIAVAVFHRMMRCADSSDSDSQNILLFFRDYGIGDAVCFLAVLRCIPELYSDGRRYRVYLAADGYACRFWQKIEAIPPSITVIPLELQDRQSFSAFSKNYERLCGYYWNQIVFFHPMGMYYRLLCMGLSYRRLYAEAGLLDLPGQRLDFLVPDFSAIQSSMRGSVFFAYEELLHLATGHQVRLQFPYIAPFVVGTQVRGSRGYAIISCGLASGHANAPRAWPIGRFAEVAGFICQELGLDLVLCGGPSERAVAAEFLSMLPETCRLFVHDRVGQTGFLEWIELTRRARFVFGNDSGYIHLATAVGTQAFVIMGYHNHGRYFPYRLRSGSMLTDYKQPLLIESAEPPCVFCNCPWFLHGNQAALWQKKQCDAMVRKDGVYSCINAVTADQAITAIRAWWMEELEERQ